MSQLSQGYTPGRTEFGLADVLDRVLDKGVVVIGDITVSLCNVELLNIRLKLLIASVETAKKLGVNFDWANTDTSQNHPEVK